MTIRFLHLQVAAASYHRNGSFGAGYHLVHLLHGGHVLRAVVFDAAEHVAVLDEEDASWRCEDFEPALRGFIATSGCRSLCWPSQFAANEA